MIKMSLKLFICNKFTHMARRLLYFLIVSFLTTSCHEAHPDHKNTTTQEGAELYAKYGCTTCHSMDGSEMYGPTLESIYLKEIQVIRDGKEDIVTANRRYLKKAIKEPDYEKVAGFEKRVMPEPSIPKKDLMMLIEYIVSESENK